jgi:homoserine dehydrogenase
MQIFFTGNLKKGKIEINPEDKSFSVSLGLRALPKSHPLAGASGSVNQVVIQTDRYPEPMVINGPGAGPARTATGVFGDLLLLIPTSGN